MNFTSKGDDYTSHCLNSDLLMSSSVSVLNTLEDYSKDNQTSNFSNDKHMASYLIMNTSLILYTPRIINFKQYHANI